MRGAKDYFEGSKRTESGYDDAIAYRFTHITMSEALGVKNLSPEKSMQLTHGIEGLVGELSGLGELGDKIWSELTRESVLKEIGDAWWYAARIADALDLSFEELAEKVDDETMKLSEDDQNFAFRVGRLSEPLKKWHFYGKPISIIELVTEVVCLLAKASIHDDKLLSEEIGFEEHINEVWSTNELKLRRRYPWRFAEDLAKNHDSK